MVLKDTLYAIRGNTVYNLTVNSVLDYSDIRNTNNLMCLARMIYNECEHLLLLSGKDVSIIARKNKACIIIISYNDGHEKEITLKCEKTAHHELTIVKLVKASSTGESVGMGLGVIFI